MGGGSSVQLVLVGLENTGKTTLLYRLKFGQYMHTQPTVGFNCEKVEGRCGKAKGVLFSIWDVEGKDNMRPLWKSYLRWVGVLCVCVCARASVCVCARARQCVCVRARVSVCVCV